MKNLKNWILAAGCLLLSSCETATYVGDRHDPATTNVEVFYSTHDVKKQYKVLGHMVWPNNNADEARQKMIEYARNVGADAIIITGTQTTKDNAVAAINADAIVYEK